MGAISIVMPTVININCPTFSSIKFIVREVPTTSRPNSPACDRRRALSRETAVVCFHSLHKVNVMAVFITINPKTEHASQIGFSVKNVRLIPIPNDKKKMPSNMLLKGMISAEISCLYSVSAIISPAMKAPRAIESPAMEAIEALKTIMRRLRAMKTSEPPCLLANTKTGFKASLPKKYMANTVTIILKSVKLMYPVIFSPMSVPRMVKSMRIGIIAKSCRSNMLKLALPACETKSFCS